LSTNCQVSFFFYVQYIVRVCAAWHRSNASETFSSSILPGSFAIQGPPSCPVLFLLSVVGVLEIFSVRVCCVIRTHSPQRVSPFILDIPSDLGIQCENIVTHHRHSKIRQVHGFPFGKSALQERLAMLKGVDPLKGGVMTGLLGVGNTMPSTVVHLARLCFWRYLPV